MKKPGLLLVVILLIASCFILSAVPISKISKNKASETTDIDYVTWIDANKLLMFVTNKGIIAYDITGTLGKYDGLYYPFTSVEDIELGINYTTAIYAGSIWMGGVDSATGDTLVTSGQHNTDWGVGPLVGGAPVPNAASNPAYRVYKLYSDSLGDNPNTDYNEWPVDDGAPVDGLGNPAMIGEQMCWAVYNDLDLDEHIQIRGSVGQGLGVEVHQTVWASDEAGSDTLLNPTKLPYQQKCETDVGVTIEIIDREALQGHNYEIVIDYDEGLGLVWHLLNTTLSSVVLSNQTTFSNNNTTGAVGNFESFEVVANANGPLDPIEAGAFCWAGFPVPTDADPNGYITDNQQVGGGFWGIHTADNGGTSGGGTRASYEDFLSRVTRYGSNNSTIGICDYEMRFTGDNATPGVNGGYSIEAFIDDNIFWVPFELWNTGVGTPDDPSDDYRMFPLIIDDAGADWSGDDIFFSVSKVTALKALPVPVIVNTPFPVVTMILSPIGFTGTTQQICHPVTAVTRQ